MNNHKKAPEVFDSIAKPKESKTKTTKLAATVTEDIMKAVGLAILYKAEEAAAKQNRIAQEDLIIEHVRPQQDKYASEGNYSKSLVVKGYAYRRNPETGAVEPTGGEVELTYTTSDRFSVPQDPESIEALKNLLGKKFNSLIEKRRTITLKPSAAENATLINKLQEILKAAGLSLGDVFDVEDVWVTKPDADRKQYELLSKDKLEQFRTLVKQVRPSLKF